MSPTNLVPDAEAVASIPDLVERDFTADRPETLVYTLVCDEPLKSGGLIDIPSRGTQHSIGRSLHSSARFVAPFFLGSVQNTGGAS